MSIMSHRNTINCTIKNNNDVKDEIIINQSFPKPFKQLLSLQLLIQKHSGLKELCMYSYNYFI